MTTFSAININTRIFIGCPINSELRMHLNQSIEWKHHKILNPASTTHYLQEIHHQGKDYFGFYLESTSVTINELKKIQQEIRQEIKKYCPDIETEDHSICIFSQVFIA